MPVISYARRGAHGLWLATMGATQLLKDVPTANLESLEFLANEVWGWTLSVQDTFDGQCQSKLA